MPRAEFPPQPQGAPTREVAWRKAEGAETHGTNRYAITAVPCCGFVQKHQIFGGREAGKKETKANSEGKSRLQLPPPLSALLPLHPPLPSPWENARLVPVALKRSLPGYKYPAIN